MYVKVHFPSWTLKSPPRGDNMAYKKHGVDNLLNIGWGYSINATTGWWDGPGQNDRLPFFTATHISLTFLTTTLINLHVITATHYTNWTLVEDSGPDRPFFSRRPVQDRPNGLVGPFWSVLTFSINIRKLSTMNPDPGLATSDMSEVCIILSGWRCWWLYMSAHYLSWGWCASVGPPSSAQDRRDRRKMVGPVGPWKNPKKRSARSKILRSVRTSSC